MHALRVQTLRVWPRAHAAPQVLLERLHNEITRLTAVKGWGTVAASPLVPRLDGVLQPLVLQLTSFLRKANRLLRQASLTTTEVT